MRAPYIWILLLSDSTARCIPIRLARSVDAIVKEGKSIRIQDKDGKMPLHHLCRHKAKADKDKDAFKRVFQLVLTNTKTALEALPEKKTLFGDVNHQDNDGKTPLFYALEFGNVSRDCHYRLPPPQALSAPPTRTERSVPYVLLCVADGGNRRPL